MADSYKFLYNYPLPSGFPARLSKKKLVKKLKDCYVGSWRITHAFLALMTSFKPASIL